jgi:hypothetical protein
MSIIITKQRKDEQPRQ